MGWDGLISLELISRSPSLEERENLKELFHSSWPNLDPSGTESSLHSRYLFVCKQAHRQTSLGDYLADDRGPISGPPFSIDSIPFRGKVGNFLTRCAKCLVIRDLLQTNGSTTMGTDLA